MVRVLKNQLDQLITKYDLSKTEHVNIRQNHLIPQIIANAIFEYRDFIQGYTVLENTEQLRHELVGFIKTFETIRQNSILDYAPEYADFLRHYGY